MTITENVIYSYDPDGNPAIRYHSLPGACSGTAATLGEARSSYRADLTTLLGVDRSQLPPVIEHIEAVVHGMWVRERVGTVHRDHRTDRMLLQTVLAAGSVQEDLRAYVHYAADRGCTPVVVLIEPEEPVGIVLDQMTARDTIVVAYSDAECGFSWMTLSGPTADAYDTATRSMTVAQYARSQHGVRVGDAGLMRAVG
ncbi:hypothetical protein DVS77_02330 [Mycolicibacterium moriokaense]|nr:hypothetical protein DVS77_02330 [Mycolicibacterium moriokaense]